MRPSLVRRAAWFAVALVRRHPRLLRAAKGVVGRVAGLRVLLARIPSPDAAPDAPAPGPSMESGPSVGVAAPADPNAPYLFRPGPPRPGAAVVTVEALHHLAHSL